MSEKQKLNNLADKALAAVASLVDSSDTKTTTPDDGPGWIKYVAVLTGVLAAITGIIAVRSTRLTNDAIYESSLAVLAQAQASDAWAEYQADSIKAHILEFEAATANTLSDADKNKLHTDLASMRERQPALKQNAIDRAAERDAHLIDGRNRLAEKDLLEYAALAAQIGIALASVAAMTKRHPAFGAGLLAGVASLGLLAYALVQHYLPVIL